MEAEIIARSVAYAAFYMIVMAVFATLIVQIFLRPKNQQEWAEFCKMLAFNLVVWRQVWTIATGQLLPPEVAVVLWTICFLLVGFYFLTLMTNFGFIVVKRVCVNLRCQIVFLLAGLAVTTLFILFMFTWR